MQCIRQSSLLSWESSSTPSPSTPSSPITTSQRSPPKNYTDQSPAGTASSTAIVHQYHCPPPLKSTTTIETDSGNIEKLIIDQDREHPRKKSENQTSTEPNDHRHRKARRHNINNNNNMGSNEDGKVVAQSGIFRTDGVSTSATTEIIHQKEIGQSPSKKKSSIDCGIDHHAKKPRAKWLDRWKKVGMLCRIAAAFRNTLQPPTTPRRKSNSLSLSREMPLHHFDDDPPMDLGPLLLTDPLHQGNHHHRDGGKNSKVSKLRRASSLNKPRVNRGLMDTLKTTGGLLPRPNPEATKLLFEALAHEHKLKMKLKEARKTDSDAKSTQIAFEFLMYSPKGRNWFQKFLKSEYADENLLFWNACQNYRKAAEAYYYHYHHYHKESSESTTKGGGSEASNNKGIIGQVEQAAQLQQQPQQHQHETKPTNIGDPSSILNNNNADSSFHNNKVHTLRPYSKKAEFPCSFMPAAAGSSRTMNIISSFEPPTHLPGKTHILPKSTTTTTKKRASTTTTAAEKCSRSSKANSSTTSTSSMNDDDKGRGGDLAELRRIRQTAAEIWRTYVQINAALEVNLSSEMKNSIEAAVTGTVASKQTTTSQPDQQSGTDWTNLTATEGALSSSSSVAVGGGHTCKRNSRTSTEPTTATTALCGGGMDEEGTLLISSTAPQLFVPAQRHVYEMLEREPFKRFLHSDFINKLLENVECFDDT